MKVLVVGATGQVGQEVVLIFEQQGHEVLACGSKDLDITHEQQVRLFLSQQQDVNFIINCAAYTAVDKAESHEEQAYALNALGPKYLALYASQYRIPLIHLSTDYVFDGTKPSAYVEGDIMHSLNVYGKTKGQGELFIREFLGQHLIVRVSWIFGRFGHNFVKTMLRLFHERSELSIVDDQRGCPTFAEDVAMMLLQLCEYNLQHKPHWGTYHYCGAPETTWFDFANKIYALSGITKPCVIKAVRTEDYPSLTIRPKNSVLVIDKIQKDFGIKPASWELGLQKMLQALRTEV